MIKPTIAKINNDGNGIYFYQVTKGKKVLATGMSKGYTYENNVFTTSGLYFNNVSEVISF